MTAGTIEEAVVVVVHEARALARGRAVQARLLIRPRGPHARRPKRGPAPLEARLEPPCHVIGAPRSPPRYTPHQAQPSSTGCRCARAPKHKRQLP